MTFVPQQGAELLGRFRLLGRLGGDALGAVWKAEAIGGDGRYALKFLIGEGTGTAAVEHVRRALLVYELIEHEGAVPILEVLGLGEADDTLPVAVTPYISGVDLDGWLRYEPRMLREGVAILREAIDVLESAHGHVDTVGRPDPIAHLGLKPAEIVVGHELYKSPRGRRRMRVRIVDFGLVRDLMEEDASGTVTMVGSPRYASPELFLRPDIAGPAADVWSIGVMLYVMASGRYPFGEPTDTPFMLQRRIVDGEVPSLEDVVPGLSPEFYALVDRCLEKDPKQRFPDAGALAEAFDALPRIGPSFLANPFPVPKSARPRLGAAVLESSSPSMVPPSLPPPPAPSMMPPRSPMRTAFRVGASLAALAAVGAAGYFFPRERPAPTPVTSVVASSDAGTVALTDTEDAAIVPAPTGLVATLLEDNPFRGFRTPDAPKLLGCEREPPAVSITVQTSVEPQMLRPATIDGGLLAGLRRQGVCGAGESRDASGRCWVMGCPSSTSGPDDTGHCIATHDEVAPIQSCFRSGAAVLTVGADEHVELQEHEVTFGELGRYLAETSQRAWLAVDPASGDPRPIVWDGSFAPERASFPAHGVPRVLAERYCSAIEARLPTEAELETAARGRSFAAAPWGRAVLAYGTQIPSLGPSGSRPRPVRDEASLDRTVADDPIYDLVSNVREWSRDVYRPDGIALATEADAGVSDAAIAEGASPTAPSGVTAPVANVPLGVVRGLPLVLPDGWPRTTRPRDLQALLPVPAAYRTPLCVSASSVLDVPGACASATPGYVAALRDVGFRCARGPLPR